MPDLDEAAQTVTRMTPLRLLVILNVFSCLVIGEVVRYDNYRVYRVIPKNEDQVKALEELEGLSDSVIFLNNGGIVNKETYVVVAPHKQMDFAAIANATGIAYDLEETNLQRYIQRENEHLAQFGSRGVYNWRSYHTLDQTYSWMKELSQKHSTVELITAGRSFEGRQIQGVKLSHGPGRQGIFIEGGMHAREWISPAVATYIANELLTSNDKKVKRMAEKYDWYIVPHTNPDGFVFTHSGNRLWRKTRSRNGFCVGADPNRNWNFQWRTVGASSYPCSDTFCGGSAFSEIETRTLSQYLTSLKGSLRAYLSLHSFSQLLLFPYGHTKAHASNHDNLQQIGNAAVKALARRYGTKYRVGNTYETIYPASGSSVDWAYGHLNIPLSYTYELRPAGGWNGFILPADQIIPTGEETLDSIVALIEEAETLKYFK